MTTEVVSMNVTATPRRLPRLFKFVRVRLSRKLWGTYRVRLGNIVSRTLSAMLLGIGLPVLGGPRAARW